MVIHGNRNACKRKGYTSNSSSSSKIRWVAEVSSLCLDFQEATKKGRKDGEKMEINEHACAIIPRESLMYKKK